MRWFLLMVVVVALAGCGPQPGLVFDKVVGNYGKIQQVEEQMECFLAPLGVNLNGTGYLKCPDKIAADFGEPMEAKIVSDGQTMWISVPAYQTTLKMSVSDKNAEISPQHIKTFLFPERPLGQLAEKFSAKKASKGKLNGQEVWILDIVPKDASSEISSATLWVEDATGAVRKYETKDKTGQVRCRLLCDSIAQVSGVSLAKELKIEEGNGNLVGTIKVSEIKVNGAIPDSVFAFKPPQGQMLMEEMPVLGIPMPDILPLQ